MSLEDWQVEPLNLKAIFRNQYVLPWWCVSKPLSKSRHCVQPGISNSKFSLHTLLCGWLNWERASLKFCGGGKLWYLTKKIFFIFIFIKKNEAVFQIRYTWTHFARLHHHPFKWTTYVVHELVKRRLEGNCLMELLPGWEKVSPLVPTAQPPKTSADLWTWLCLGVYI